MIHFELHIWRPEADRVEAILKKIKDIRQAEKALAPHNWFVNAQKEIDAALTQCYTDLGREISQVIEKKERNDD